MECLLKFDSKNKLLFIVDGCNISEMSFERIILVPFSYLNLLDASFFKIPSSSLSKSFKTFTRISI